MVLGYLWTKGKSCVCFHITSCGKQHVSGCYGINRWRGKAVYVSISRYAIRGMCCHINHYAITLCFFLCFSVFLSFSYSYIFHHHCPHSFLSSFFLLLFLLIILFFSFTVSFFWLHVAQNRVIKTEKTISVEDIQWKLKLGIFSRNILCSIILHMCKSIKDSKTYISISYFLLALLCSLTSLSAELTF